MAISLLLRPSVQTDFFLGVKRKMVTKMAVPAINVQIKIVELQNLFYNFIRIFDYIT
jgi:hypothetical protein